MTGFLLRITLGVALLVGTAGAVAAQSVDVFLDPPEQCNPVGTTFDGAVRIDANTLPVGGGGVFIEFDNSLLAYQSGTNDIATGDRWIARINSRETENTIHISTGGIGSMAISDNAGDLEIIYDGGTILLEDLAGQVLSVSDFAFV